MITILIRLYAIIYTIYIMYIMKILNEIFHIPIEQKKFWQKSSDKKSSDKKSSDKKSSDKKSSDKKKVLTKYEFLPLLTLRGGVEINLFGSW